MAAGFELLEHGADYGVRGTGNTFEQAFEECAKAMFSILKDLKNIRAKETVEVEVQAVSKEELLVKWLNELLYKSHVDSFLFKEFKIGLLEQQGKQWVLKGKAFGEKVDFSKELIAIEVKGATFTGLKVGKEGEKFIAQWVVDV